MAETHQEPDLAYFQSIPWCAQLLSSPDTVITRTNSRVYKASSLDALFSETLNTKDTISACICFYPRPTPGASRVEEAHLLLTLGYGVNGYPGRAHGGIISTILDEVMGILLGINQGLGLTSTQGDTMTAYLNVSYVKPVPTPATVLLSAKFKDVVGRKYFLDATIKDGNGVVLSRAEGLFIRTEKFIVERKL